MQTDKKNLNIIFKKILTVLIVSILFCAFCAVICNISAVKNAKYENTFEDFSTKNQENSEKIKFELKLIYSDGKEEEIDLGIIKNESEFESVYYTVGARYVSDKNFYIAHAFNMAYELQPIPEMLAIVSESEEFSKYEGIYIHEY